LGFAASEEWPVNTSLRLRNFVSLSEQQSHSWLCGFCDRVWADRVVVRLQNHTGKSACATQNILTFSN